MSHLLASGLSANTSINRKTGYNHHFPRSFLLNYGPALQNPNEEAILNRLHNWNCEWLSRPNIAISELAMTIKDNMLLIRQYSGTIFVPEFVEDLLSSFDELLPGLAHMDNKDKSDQTPASREDVVGLLRNLDQNNVLVEAIIDGFIAAGPLMIVTTQILPIQTLMRNPEEFAEKVTQVPQSLGFRENPTARGMRNYTLDNVTKKRRVIPRSISVWDEEEDEDQEAGRCGRSGRRRMEVDTRGRQSSRARPQPQQQDVWDDSPTVTSRGRRQAVSSSHQTAQRRKRPTRPPLDDPSEAESADEVLTQRDPLPTKRRRQVQPVLSTSTVQKEETSNSSSTGSENSSN